VILGKTRSTEFAAFHPATTANPHDLRHTPGGSSSGSAAAVADAMVPLAYGTQTAGSIIRPASYCGVVGFKPTFGVIDRSGVMLFADSLDTVGVFARSVEDAALLAGVVAGWDALAEAPAAATVRRVLVCRAPRWSQLAAEASAAVESALDVFGAAGATVQELVLPADFEALVEVQKTVQAFEGARALAYEVSAHQERLSPELLEMFAGALKTSFEHFLDCLRTAASWRSRFDELVAEADCIVTASALGEAPQGLEATGDPLLNRIWTLLHMPAVTLPCGTGPQGLPVGVQLLGRRWGDAQLIGTARWLAERMKEDGAAKD
jgi:amidase